MKENIELYEGLTLEKLESVIGEILKSKRSKREEVFFINEGNGYIPFFQSKTFDKAMKRKRIGLGWSTLYEYAPLSSDIEAAKKYWEAIYDKNIKTNTIDDLKKLNLNIDKMNAK